MYGVGLDVSTNFTWNLVKESTATKPTFDDVDAKKWYFGAVKAAYEEGLISGTGTRQFSP